MYMTEIYILLGIYVIFCSGHVLYCTKKDCCCYEMLGICARTHTVSAKIALDVCCPQVSLVQQRELADP